MPVIRTLFLVLIILHRFSFGFLFQGNGQAVSPPIIDERNHQHKLCCSNDEEEQLSSAGMGRREFTSAALTSVVLSQAAGKAQAAGVFEFFNLKSARNIPQQLFNPEYEVKPLEPYLSLSPQSALLYLLPLNSRPFRQIQKQIERSNGIRASFLLNANTTTIPNDTWSNIEQSAKASQATLVGFREQLYPPFSANAPADVQVKISENFEDKYDDLKSYLSAMGAAATKRDAVMLLREQEKALMTLGEIGEGMIEEFPYQIPEKKKYTTVPRLLGRATVDLLIERPSADPGERILGNVTIIADGYSAPITAGNFVDLCQRGFYDELPLVWNNISTENAEFSLPVGGTYRDGFVDPVTGKVRRVPLEILRYSTVTQKQIPQYGAVNSKLFTKDPIIQSFKVSGAVSMYHPPGDKNGASSQFFFLPGDINRSKEIEKLNGNYAIFGYIVGGKDIVDKLKKGDQIKKAYVTRGYDKLRKMKPNFLKTLMETFKEED